jgi:hypothetical protein
MCGLPGHTYDDSGFVLKIGCYTAVTYLTAREPQTLKNSFPLLFHILFSFSCFFYDRGKPDFLLVVDLEFWVPLLPAPKVKKQTNVFQKK